MLEVKRRSVGKTRVLVEVCPLALVSLLRPLSSKVSARGASNCSFSPSTRDGNNVKKKNNNNNNKRVNNL